MPGAAVSLVRLLRPERPLLERGAAPVVIETDNPQVAVLLADRIPVADLDPHHRRVAVGGDDAAGHAEHLIGTLAFRFPHDGDRGQADDGLVVGALPVDGVLGEDPGERAGTGRPPGTLVSRDPVPYLLSAHDRPVHRPASLFTPGGRTWPAAWSAGPRRG